MTKNTRSLCGAILMLMIIPIFAGLLACMPVPIGNPERSRIDPDLNGPWAMEDGGDVNLYLYQPYDLSLIHISEPTRLKTRSRMPSSA